MRKEKGDAVAADRYEPSHGSLHERAEGAEAALRELVEAFDGGDDAEKLWDAVEAGRVLLSSAKPGER